MNEEQATTQLAVKLITQTDNAVLLALEDEDWEEYWVPKSVIEESYYDDEGGEVTVKDWWLETKGII